MPSALPDAHAVMGRAGGENFPVALRLLRPAHRRHLLAVYGFARLADEVGDEVAGDRFAALDRLRSELERAYEGRATHPLMVRLQHTLAECALPRAPLERLIEANRVDQDVTRYETFQELLGYCELSANPVGELVLHVFGLATAQRIAWSDRICSALQIAEHLQDVVEDLGRGRVYLPAQDMERFGLSAEQLLQAAAHGAAGWDAAPASGASLRARMRELVALEVGRARELLDQGAGLVSSVKGRPRLAVAGFLAGGRAALDAIERSGFDVLDGPPKARGAQILVQGVRVLAGAAR